MKRIFSLLLLMVCMSAYAQSPLTPEILWQMGRVSDPQISPDGKQIVFGVTRYDVKENKGNRDLFLIPVQGGIPVRLTNTPGSEQSARWRPDGKKIGFMASEGGASWLFEMNPDGTGLQKVEGLPSGITGFIYSPKQTHILFTKEVKIKKNVQDLYPDLPKAEARIYDDLMYRHWDTWEDGAYSHVFFTGYDNGKAFGDPVDILKGEPCNSPLAPFGGIEEITWSPDGKTIAYTCEKVKSGREDAVQTNSDIYLYHIETASTVNLTEGMPGYDFTPAFSPDGARIAWISMERAAHESDKERLFIWDLSTKKKEYLTQAFDQDVISFKWSPSGKSIHFVSGTRATQQLYSIDTKTRAITQHTKGQHNYISLSPAGNKFIAERQSMSMPTEIYSVDMKTGKDEQLTFTNKDLLAGIKMGKVEERNITTTDGKKMLVWVIYPPDFDPAKKYPALLYCQGGPHSAVSQFFSYRWNFQLMAAPGYIVVAPNRRGLPSFGQEWNDQISGDWGGQNMKDYLTAIDSVSAEPFVDKDRLGAVGASYGGYSVFYLAGNHNKRFKVFIAHAGLFNLESWYGTTEELFFANTDVGGNYWDKPVHKAYAEFSPHRFVDKWDTPILILHGEKDYRVPLAEGMQAFNVAQMRGIPSRFVTFPGENHWIQKPQNSLLWFREFSAWLDKYLKK